MIAIPHKAKQFLLVLVKLAIVTAAFYYLYSRLSTQRWEDWEEITTRFSLISLLGILLLTGVNWLFEVFKWQELVKTLQPISLKNALEQTLGSLTASIFTPNRVGEYGAKVLYFSKTQRKKVILLNFLNNSLQMSVTVLFGILGLWLYPLPIGFPRLWMVWVVVALIVMLLLVVFGFKKWTIYGYSLQVVYSKIKELPQSSLLTVFQLSVLRFLVFSHQWYFLLELMGASVPYPTAMATIFAMYFLASLVPTIHLMDVAIKGSVGVLLFGNLGINEWIIVSVTSVMWVLNLVIPVLAGSVYVLQFKPKTT
jgi:uncharacterized membrane protein YbhN (UPF0104 family)